jgi:hypothetical protein
MNSCDAAGETEVARSCAWNRWGVRWMNDSYYFLTNSLTEDEMRIITCIANHIEKSKERVNITQIANENFVSASFIIKMCKRLGFNGYSELYYNLSQKVNARMQERCTYEFQTLVDNYSEESVKKLCDYFQKFRERKIFVVGAGFADLVADYIVQRLGVSGFMVFKPRPFLRLHAFSRRQQKDDALQYRAVPDLCHFAKRGNEHGPGGRRARSAERFQSGFFYEAGGILTGGKIGYRLCCGRIPANADFQRSQYVFRQGYPRV